MKGKIKGKQEKAVETGLEARVTVQWELKSDDKITEQSSL
jgi:hypothetical protein